MFRIFREPTVVKLLLCVYIVYFYQAVFFSQVWQFSCSVFDLILAQLIPEVVAF